MKLKDMKKEELEVLSYTDLTELIIKENKKSMNTASIFKTICDLLDLTSDDYTNKIGDYYTSLTTDKRFILLDNSEWDLKDKHKVEIVLDDDMDEDAMEDEDEEASFDEEDSDNNGDTDNDSMDSIEITDDEVDLDDDDDMDDLSIVDEEDIDEEL